MRKLGFQVIAWREDILQYCIQTRVQQLKVLDANPYYLSRIKAEIPECFVTYRKYADMGRQLELIGDPKAGAMAFADEILQSAYGAMAYIDAYEGLNEVDGALWGDGAARYNEWTAEYARLMRGNGCKTVAYNWSVGCPQGFYQGDGNTNPDEFREGLRQHWGNYLDGLRESDYLGLHEYSAPAMWNGQSWLCLRYRRVWDILPDDCKKPLLITETGIDSGVTQPYPGLFGWRYYGLSEQQYLDQLQWYNEQIYKDTYVHGAHIFQVGSPAPQWQSFDIAGCYWIGQYIRNQPDVAVSTIIPSNGGSMPVDQYEAIFRDMWQRQGVNLNPDDAFFRFAIQKAKSDGVYIIPQPSKDGNYYTEVNGYLVGYTSPPVYCSKSDYVVKVGLPPFFQ